MFEVVDAEIPVTLFMDEDEQRPLAERVANFLLKECRNYTIIDTWDYELKGISEEFRGSISHLVMHAVNPLQYTIHQLTSSNPYRRIILIYG